METSANNRYLVGSDKTMGVGTTFDARILVINGDEDRKNLIMGLLRSAGYRNCRGIVDSNQVIETFLDMDPDLVILGLDLAQGKAFDVLHQIGSLISPDDYLPILVLTGDTSRETREQALSSGASDFVSHPLTTTELKLRVRNLLHARRLRLELADRNMTLDQRVQERTAELESAKNELLERLAFAAELHDDETGEHTRRVAALSRAISLELGMDEYQADRLAKAALLHDIGKIGIPDSVLMKPGRLTPEEFEVVKKHTRIGSEILGGSQSRLLQLAESIALTHHERWDGGGYSGLVGRKIPIEGRIVAVADVFDALTHKRPYKDAWSIPDAMDEIRSKAGTQFDPDVVNAFVSVLSRKGVPAPEPALTMNGHS